MARSREVAYLKDFTGGLNLTDPLGGGLAENESPDCLNVDFGYRGGFVTRGGFRSQTYSTSLDGARFLGATYFGADVVLVADANGGLFSWNGSTLTNNSQDLTDTTIAANPLEMAVFDDKAYFANGRSAGNIVMRSWDGSTLSTLTNTFNNDYTTPDAGDMPLARHICQHNGYMFVADTVESSVRYPHRVRFSHLQQPEDWAEADYFEVEKSDDGDPIIGIKSFKDQLLVFKKSAVYAVFGYSGDEFFRERISETGVNSIRAVTSNSGVMYWAASDGTIMAYNGRGAVPLTDKLKWWFDTTVIDPAGDNELMWADGKLFISLAAGSSAAADQSRWLFVYDPVIKAITRYDKKVVDMFHWERLDQEHDPLFLFESGTIPSEYNLYRYDRAWSTDSSSPDTVDDEDGDPIITPEGDALLNEDTTSTSTDPVDAYYCTAWITANETATKKRWKRPRVTAAAEGDTTINMGVYHDYNSGVQTKTSDIVIDAGDASLWGSFTWGTNTWAGEQDDYYEFARQPSAGSGYAVQFRFSSVNNPGRWWVDSIAVPFRRKEVR